MGLRSRLENVVETLTEIELAARRRYDDAVALFLANQFAGAIYILGYVAEIHLKSAVYRRLGALPSHQAEVFRRRAGSEAKRLALPDLKGQAESGHGVRYCARLLWSLPNTRGQLLSSELRTPLWRHVFRIHSNWWVEMRYYSDPATRDEAAAAFRSVEWIMKHQLSLWR